MIKRTNKSEFLFVKSCFRAAVNKDPFEDWNSVQSFTILSVKRHSFVKTFEKHVFKNLAYALSSTFIFMIEVLSY